MEVSKIICSKIPPQCNVYTLELNLSKRFVFQSPFLQQVHVICKVCTQQFHIFDNIFPVANGNLNGFLPYKVS